MKQKFILLADKDEVIRKAVKGMVEDTCFGIKFAGNPVEMLKNVEKYNPVLLLMDLGLFSSTENAFKFCKNLRRQTQLPVMMFSSKNSVEELIKGIDCGADAYIIKPFDTRELWARIKALLRRSGANSWEFQRVIDWPNLHVDTKECRIVAFGKDISLTRIDHRLFAFLATNPNRTFSRAELIKEVWQFSTADDGRTVDAHIKIIRKSLGLPKDSPWKIVTEWGKGYKFQLKGV